MHGTTMVFLVVVPILAGFGNFLAPLMIGAVDMAFPRLNALSYWLFLFGGVVLMLSFFADGGPASAGWTSYPPLSVQTVGNGQDLWILSLHILSIVVAPGRDQLHRDDPQHARARHVVHAHAALRLGAPDLRDPAAARTAGAVRRADAAADRAPVRRRLLRAHRRRQPGAVPARLLVLRTPRGLHHDPAGLRDDLGDHPGLRAQADLRLQGGRVRDDRHRLLLDARLGPPHVHGRDARRAEQLLHDLVVHHRGAPPG